ncbi:hypothetical protein [Halorussus pelagicus]|uniref:hypothetical protein n=1 Tax=Halorussus pelagicus TaxID=2505977 RepID=UPI000FFB10C0|nr:hypothetical protein [Halorussus pelagicus]
MAEQSEMRELVNRLRAIQYVVAALIFGVLSISAVLMPDGQNFSLILMSVSIGILFVSFHIATKDEKIS